VVYFLCFHFQVLTRYPLTLPDILVLNCSLLREEGIEFWKVPLYIVHHVSFHTLYYKFVSDGAEPFSTVLRAAIETCWIWNWFKVLWRGSF